VIFDFDPTSGKQIYQGGDCFPFIAGTGGYHGHEVAEGEVVIVGFFVMSFHMVDVAISSLLLPGASVC